MALTAGITVNVRIMPNVIQKKEHVTARKDGLGPIVASFVHVISLARTAVKHATVKRAMWKIVVILRLETVVANLVILGQGTSSNILTFYVIFQSQYGVFHHL